MTGELAPGIHLQNLRHRRGLTQEALAHTAELSVSTVRKIEQGGSARIETLHALARALDVETSSLFGSTSPGPVPDAEEGDKLNLLPLRQVLTPVVGIRGIVTFGAETSGDVQEADLRAALSEAVRLYHADDFDAVAMMLPRMVRDSHQLIDRATVETRSPLLRLRAEIYQLAGWFLTQVRQYDLAYAAIRDAIQDATSAGDSLTAASGAISQAWLFIRQGRFGDAENLARNTAEAIEPRMSTASDAELSAWGWLLLRGSAAAIRDNRRDSSDEFLSLAETAATRVSMARPPDGYHQYLTTFGPAVVAMKRAESLMIMGDARGVLRLADRIPAPRSDRYRSDNLSRHLLDVAAAHAALRDHRDAADVLVHLRQNSPEWLRHQRKGKDVLSAILRSRKRPLSQELRSLVDFMELTD
ncbi:helix-turn-helix domain-containing protein [Frankia sp. AgB32]|uniref:helix-turn-helix domain-containing protein n=1 Tax=Frankia sp. AgB32 TaxID=631119 RepID=UPI00200D3698|nr:helix-turn-helix transcriptional regulator [Frankia sp. AgB32]MCK9895328.1 helix-turn-helix domain-containing protein [Frankia sp. AgB32]